MSERVTREAARWFTRLQHTAADDPLRGDFERWLCAHPAHAAEFQALCEVWDDFDSTERSRKLAGAARQQRGNRRGLGMAAAVLAVVVLGVLIAPRAWEAWQTQPLQQLAFATGPGEVRTQALPDGSQVVLGADSALTLVYSRRDRQVQLTRGEAEFEVQHETGSAARRFTVQARAAEVTVLGTRFVVAHAVDAVQVTVAQGRTLVATAGIPGSVILGKGEAADVRALLAPQPVTRAFDEAADFTAGRIVFRGATLAEIADTLSRYRVQPVRAVDAAHGPRITAVVQPDDVEGFLAMLPRIAAVSVRQEPGETRLLPR